MLANPGDRLVTIIQQKRPTHAKTAQQFGARIEKYRIDPASAVAIGYQHFFVWVILVTVPSFLVVLFIPLEAEFGRKAAAS